jgi:hypothetical protein
MHTKNHDIAVAATKKVDAELMQAVLQRQGSMTRRKNVLNWRRVKEKRK